MLSFGKLLTRRTLFAAAAAVALLAGAAGTAHAQVDLNAPWRSAEGRAYIEEWIQLAMGRLNSSDLGRDANSRKPWHINQYGLIMGRNMWSNRAPDFWPQYEGRLHVVWATYNRDSFSGQFPGSLAFMNRATPAIPSVQHYVRERLQRHVSTGPAALPGRWTWFANGDVEFFADGTFRQAQVGLTGRWVYTPGRVTMHWSHGYRDELSLSSDGRYLSGQGFPGGHRVWGSNRSH